MRKHFLYGLFLALLTACTTGHYRIQGIYTAEDGTPVWLIDQNAKDTLAETAVQDGRFSFSGRIQEPIFSYVGNGKQRIHFILEPGTATVDIDERTASGMPMEDAYTAFHRRFYGFKREQRAEKAALADSMVRANRDNLVGAVALEDLAHVDTDRFLSLYELLPDDLQAFYLVKSAYDAIQIQRATAPGQPFTDYLIAGGNPDGTDVKLSDYVGRGRYILLDHWASWCGPCKAEMPYIKKTWEAFHGERFDGAGAVVPGHALEPDSGRAADSPGALWRERHPAPDPLRAGRDHPQARPPRRGHLHDGRRAAFALRGKTFFVAGESFF